MRVEGSASVTANITVDLKRVRQNDDVVKNYNKNSFQLTIITLVFLIGAAALLWFGRYIFGGIVGAIALLLVFVRIRRGGYSNDFLEGVYTEGLLVPAIIRKTEPLTILAIGTLTTWEHMPERYGCREFAVSGLPGHKLQVGERVPCSAMYQESSTSDYWKHYEVHPLCWATDNIEGIRQNEPLIDATEWDALESLVRSLPDKDLDLLYILDGEFNHISSRKYYDETKEEIVPGSTLFDNYPKHYGNIPDIDKDIPHADTYRYLLDRSISHQVYEYLFQHEKDGDPRYLTYVSDPIAFMKKMDNFGAQLSDGEIPIVAGNFLVTTKGMWCKEEFTSWKDIQIDIYVGVGDLIYTKMNEKKLTYFNAVYDNYDLQQEQMKDEKNTLNSLEKHRLSDFWQEMKKNFE